VFALTDPADSPDGAALDLSRELVAEQLRLAHRERWSGVLLLEQGQVAKRLYLLRGDLAVAGSTVEEDRLGAQLFRDGKITETQFRSALQASERTGRHIGGALRRAGVVTAHELLHAVSGQLERIVLSVLRWTSGSLRREPLPAELPTQDPIGLDPRPLLLVGTRLFPQAARLESALGKPERWLIRARPAPFDVESLPPTPAERAVLALCASGCQLEQLLLAMPQARDDVVRAIFGLSVAGLLEGTDEAT
jgi:hypothetical protein